jgi:hypothetical protein
MYFRLYLLKLYVIIADHRMYIYTLRAFYKRGLIHEAER